MIERLRYIEARLAVIMALAERIDKEAGCQSVGAIYARAYSWDITDAAEQLRKALDKINQELAQVIFPP